MSVESMAACLHHSRAKGTAKLVLLGIANHDGDGGAWPTVGTLAKYANVHERNIQKAVEALVGLGEIRVHVQAGGTRDLDDYSRPNRYDVLVACPPWCDRTTQHRDTRKRSGRQTVLPVDKPGGEYATPYPNQGEGVALPPPGGVAVAPPKPSTQPDPTPVPASTTDRAREDRPPIPANPPADELAKVRERLRQASEQHHAREQHH